MSDALELVVVLAAVYLVECLQVVPRGAVAVQALFSRRFTARAAAPIGLWRGAAVVVGMPLPPLGLLFVVDEWPVVLGEHDLAGEDGVRRPWASARDASAVRMRVVVDGATVASLATEAGAEALARALRDIARGKPAQRRRLVDDVLAARMDGVRARRRVDAFRRAVVPLRVAGSLLFLALFAGIPLIFATKLAGWWLEIVLGGALAWAATFVAFLRARRQCGDGPPAGRAVMLALWPLAAIRAGDLLGRHILHDADPLAAATLLGPVGFRAAARRALAEPRYGTDRRDAWFDERLTHAIAGLLRDEGVSADELFAPPAPDTPDARTFCPRCRVQYVTPRPCCASCRGIRLLPLA